MIGIVIWGWSTFWFTADPVPHQLVSFRTVTFASNDAHRLTKVPAVAIV